MARLNRLCLLLSILPLFACSKSADQVSNGSSQKTGQMAPSAKPIEGEGELKFGMNFDDALSAGSGIHWEGQSLLDCRNEIPVKGCILRADQERTYWPSFAGMALVPQLLFNQKAELSDIDLERRYEAGVKPVQCESIHARVVDALTAKYGKEEPDETQAKPTGKTESGNPYYRSGKDDVLVMSGGPYAKSVAGTEVTVLTVFVGGSEYTKANCTPMIRLKGPKALKRMPLLEEDAAEKLAEMAEEVERDTRVLNEADDY